MESVVKCVCIVLFSQQIQCGKIIEIIKIHVYV